MTQNKNNTFNLHTHTHTHTHVVTETKKKTLMQKLPICFPKKTQPSKPKISQIKIYFQKTQWIRICFLRFKVSGWTLCFFESRFAANLKNIFSYDFLYFPNKTLFNQNLK